MALSLLRINCNCLTLIRRQSKSISPLGACFCRDRSLGDNRRYTRCAKGRSQCAGETLSTVKATFVDNEADPIRDANDVDIHDEHVPHHVRIMRKQIRSLHGLEPDSALERKPLKQTATSGQPESGDYYECDAAVELNTSPVQVRTDRLQKMFTFLRRQQPESSEKVIETVYGYVRLDTDVAESMPPSWQQDSSENYRKTSVGLKNVDDAGSGLNMNPVESNESKFVDRGHCKVTIGDIPSTSQPEEHPSSRVETNNYNYFTGHKSHDNIFDEQYFGASEVSGKEDTKASNMMSLHDVTEKGEGVLSGKRQTCTRSEISTWSKRGEDVNQRPTDAGFIEQQYFGAVSPTQENDSSAEKKDPVHFIDQQYFTKGASGEDNPSNTASQIPIQKTSFEGISNNNDEQSVSVKNNNNEYVRVKTKRELRMENRVKPDLENPKSAYDLAVKIRLESNSKVAGKSSSETKAHQDPKWSGETDSKGFRILRSQVLDVQNLPTSIVINLLKDSILYEDDGLIAIDKPYGLPSHGGPGIHHSVGQLLEPLAEKCRLQHGRLHLIHRLDKDTTGVMLLAKTEQSQSIIHDMFVKQKVIKKYWLITKGIPNPAEGVIDIPMAEGRVGGKVRMSLWPRYPKEHKLMVKTSRRGHCFEAVTNYKVLDSSHQTALVECQPESGVKHQIRCHMAFALNTPILGDHKYSHFSKLAPQKLHPEILQRLGIRQAKVRHLPMHLHARLIILPEYLNGRNLFIIANLPRHFKQNMKWLKLSLP